ncbi:flagellar assembly factor FliW [Diaminobutyricimonas aerilata]|uniref:Flagellar assembly factor FliW n=1 Tax=Diaminobutyricimonas aerilata TaxID=1162967 RepID=A0A2M9CN42_9MICO|nr:flagellar assembly protein FliW [Diaminobutyricimonas aerilata]PJJ73302.1 flagellar assembly factor FliW [Diaminobutyricimonas aerilata]
MTAPVRTPHAAVTFVTPPPGFAPHVRFALDDVLGADGLFALRAEDDPDIRLFVVDSTVYVPDYAPEVHTEDLDAIGAAEPDDVLVLVVATIDGGSPVVNLMAPVLVGRESGLASQVILDGDDWPLRARLGSLAS